MRYIAKSKLLIFLLALAATMTGAATDQTTEKVVLIVAKVRRADYEGSRAVLKQLYGDLAPYVQDKAIASRVAYWRGYCGAVR